MSGIRVRDVRDKSEGCHLDPTVGDATEEDCGRQVSVQPRLVPAPLVTPAGLAVHRTGGPCVAVSLQALAGHLDQGTLVGHLHPVLRHCGGAARCPTDAEEFQKTCPLGDDILGPGLVVF